MMIIFQPRVFVPVAISVCLFVACGGSEDLLKSEISQKNFKPQQVKLKTETKEDKSDTPYKLPPKPPLPKGVDVAVDCIPIAARHDELAEPLLARGWCGRQNSDGSIQIDQEVIDLLDYSAPPILDWSRHSKDLKCYLIKLSDGNYGYGYIRKDGQARFAYYAYDNECQPFGNGVFIDYENGLVVYRDESFNVVQRTDYVLANQFKNHLSKVCHVKPEKHYGIHGEHFEWRGGECGYIGTDFKIVEPIIHAYEDTPRPKGGKFDGDDPTGLEAYLVKDLQNSLIGGETLEAVFLRGSCNFQEFPTNRRVIDCQKKYSDLPAELFKEGHYIREIHLRLENQSYYRGLIVYKRRPRRQGVPYWDSEIIWKSAVPMKAPVEE